MYTQKSEHVLPTCMVTVHSVDLNIFYSKPNDCRVETKFCNQKFSLLLCRLIGPSTVFGSSNKLANVEQWRCVTILRNHTGGEMLTEVNMIQKINDVTEGFFCCLQM